MKFYKRKLLYYPKHFVYEELSPSELAAARLGAWAVLKELEKWVKEGERIATDQTRSCFVGTGMMIADLKSRHLSDPDKYRKILEKAEAWELLYAEETEKGKSSVMTLHMKDLLVKARRSLELEKEEEGK